MLSYDPNVFLNKLKLKTVVWLARCLCHNFLHDWQCYVDSGLGVGVYLCVIYVQFPDLRT